MLVAAKEAPMSLSDRWELAHVFGPSYYVSALLSKAVGVPQTISIKPPDCKQRVHLRLRSSDIIVYRNVFIDGEYAFDLPVAPEIIVDAGANVGMTTVLFANRYPKARIIAVEPESGNYELLKRNTACYPNITPLRAALWGEPGSVKIGLPRAKGEWAFAVHSEGQDVEAVTIPILMRRFNFQRIDLLKMDIEGAEKEVFESCNWIDGIGTLIIETHDRFKPGSRDAVLGKMCGFRNQKRGATEIFARDTGVLIP
jgi:FkbM family methyltransferase